MQINKADYYNDLDKVYLKIWYLLENDLKNGNAPFHMSRQRYLGGSPPGANCFKPTSGLTENINNLKYSVKESETGYQNFCVIKTFVQSIEWLYLAAKGHRRAHFVIKNNSLEKKWLIP